MQLEQREDWKQDVATEANLQVRFSKAEAWSVEIIGMQSGRQAAAAGIGNGRRR